MPRLRSLLLACAILGALPALGFGQSSSTAPEPRQDPLIAAVARITPEGAAVIERGLKRIGKRTLQDTPKRPDVEPTPAELAQIKANPAFGEAYLYQPAEALRLLRYANNLLRSGGRAP